ncbi:uncharacterized protein Z520_03548 [Fonsecaea multimorphosa CBS 102226]|uniref:DUF7587 domain-containing protein n=1 Tax=Fonsecaea multimorphosa CBS 102226 TaxID=1442371 RepID=A0A0D2IUY8_9EURO|nr:uncharacterized protein Z520_03548 [Fonsecaea multimorphosa CBS 102226]KIY00882.1 hypothetical protein Z520_03548 [Fonsecaea multimorphosa CBS 102226]OAL27708.1 hypothetical protein AYO22_03374 [Fonsecaea multimorphosa]
MPVPPLIDFPIPTFLRDLPRSKYLPNYLFFTSHCDSATQASSAGVYCGSWARDTLFMWQWIHDTPQQHFDCHFNMQSTYPTMFISTTSEFLRALLIAVGHHRRQRYGIKITVIDVKKAMESHHDITHAREIAQRLHREDAAKKKSEWVFLGRVKPCAIVHQIDFDATLCNSLFRLFPTFQDQAYLWELRSNIPRDFHLSDPYLFDQHNQAKRDAQQCAMLANWLGEPGGWTCEQKDVYLMIVGQIRMWKDDMSGADAEYQRDFLEKLSLWAPNVFHQS